MELEIHCDTNLENAKYCLDISPKLSKWTDWKLHQKGVLFIDQQGNYKEDGCSNHLLGYKTESEIRRWQKKFVRNSWQFKRLVLCHNSSQYPNSPLPFSNIPLYSLLSFFQPNSFAKLTNHVQPSGITQVLLESSWTTSLLALFTGWFSFLSILCLRL